MMPFFKRENKQGGSITLSVADPLYAKLLLEEDDTGEHTIYQPQVQSKWHLRYFISSVLLFVASLGFLVATLVMPSYICHDRLVAQHISAYSPLLDSFTPTWRPQRNITQPQPSAGSLFRQDSNPASDEAWARINDRGFLGLTRAQVEQMGQDAATVVHVSARDLPIAPPGVDPGSDEDVYIGFLDSQHLLHCLDMMRQALAFNYDRFYPEGMSSVQHGHLAHCQESLVQALTCRPSMEVIPAAWMEHQRYFFSDFDIPRRCVDWDAVMAWQEENRIDPRGPLAEGFTQKYLAPPKGAPRRKSAVLNDERLYHVFPPIGKVSLEPYDR